LPHALPFEAPQLSVARREEQHHALGLESPRRERERVGRRPVEPLRVIDHAQQRRLLCRLRQQAQDRDADQEAILHGGPREAEAAGKGRRLRLRKTRRQPEDRPDELMQRGEGDLGLCLDPTRAQHPHPLRPLARVAEQRRLADARLAPHDQCAAARGPRGRDQAVDSGTLRVAAEEHLTIVTPAATPRTGDVAGASTLGLP
jgi:hypothetical protein